MWKDLQYAVLICGLVLGGPVFAQDKKFSLNAPEDLVASGFIKFLLPRFSLKTQVRIELAPNAEAVIGGEGTPVFRRDDEVFALSDGGDGDVDRFRDWLLSEVGKRTIEAFEIDGVQVFTANVAQERVVEVIAPTGDAVLGEKLSLLHCGRCHVVSEKNRMSGMGSSPSFRLLRTFSDWQERFEAFFVLKPHPAFTQIEDVTEPFPIDLPSPIIPLEITLEDLDAILAYVAGVEPADLGAPIKAPSQ
jgi:hypothetical protein